MMLKAFLILVFIQFSALAGSQSQELYVLILGVTQDGGYPHIGCDKLCCSVAPQDSAKKFVTALALVDGKQMKWWLFEATPNITAQLDLMQSLTNQQFNYLPDGIFLTHAHIGHYTGLMYFGREALSSKNLPVYVLPKMEEFLLSNGPWSQLVLLKNIELKVLQPEKPYTLSNTISIVPFLVPHRDEYSETAGFRIQTSEKKYLFIPDINKWDKWYKDFIEEVKQVDVAFIDATFYSANELPWRDIKEVPHPLVTETMEMVTETRQRNKIFFIHFNHTNPLLWDANKQREILQSGFGLSTQGSTY